MQVKAEKYDDKDMSIEELQQHTVKVVEHMHNDDASQRGCHPDVHDPSQAPSVQEHLKKST